MRKGQLRYLLISPYNGTIFLRQKSIRGEWVLQYSSVIEHSAAGGQGGEVSALEYIWCLMDLTLTGHQANSIMAIDV